MCRWFAYISQAEPVLLSDVLIRPANAITKQCSEHYLPGLLPHGHEKDLQDAPDQLLKLRNHLLNYDGLGVAWYTPSASAYTALQTGLRPALYKSQSPPTNDFNFQNICENTESICVFAHIRAATGSAVTPVNSHPFAFGRHLFMHNGGISDFSHVRRALSDELSFDTFENIHGTTDSEHAAALYMTFLCGHDATHDAWQKTYPLEQMKVALQKTVLAIMRIQAQILGLRNIHANTLNFCTTDGIKLVACRFRNHATQQPASLYWSEFAGRSLNRKYPGDPDGVRPDPNPHQTVGDDAEIGKHTIVASEPTTYDESEWHLIGKNCMLLVDEFGVETEVSLTYDETLNADT